MNMVMSGHTSCHNGLTVWIDQNRFVPRNNDCGRSFYTGCWMTMFCTAALRCCVKRYTRVDIRPEMIQTGSCHHTSCHKLDELNWSNLCALKQVLGVSFYKLLNKDASHGSFDGCIKRRLRLDIRRELFRQWNATTRHASSLTSWIDQVILCPEQGVGGKLLQVVEHDACYGFYSVVSNAILDFINKTQIIQTWFGHHT